VVIGHHPIYSSSSKHGDAIELQGTYKKIMENNKADIYMAGHEHDLQHLRSANSNIDYFISGAGSEVRPTGTNNKTRFAESTPGFAIVAVTDKQLHWMFIDATMKVRYEWKRSTSEKVR